MSFQTMKKLPGSLSLQRASVISDGRMLSGFPQEANRPAEPLHVLYHGIRGTQNVAGDKEKGAAIGNARGREVSNVQHTESAKLATGADHLVVEFEVRFLDLDHVLFACAPGKSDTMDEINGFKAALKHFIQQAKTSPGLHEVALRYVRNIVNGRWLWRNRVSAERIEIQVGIVSPGAEGAARQLTQPLTFQALDYPLNRFDQPSPDEEKLAQVIVGNLSGHNSSTLHVRANVYFGMGNVEVFPSQNYLEDKPKGFSRSLYKIGIVKVERQTTDNQQLGQAALRDQKIGNALRTIDTWYDDYAQRGVPIPVEPNGASLEAQQFFRSKKSSAFELMKNIGNLDPNSDDGKFMIAALVRGGVYSEGE